MPITFLLLPPQGIRRAIGPAGSAGGPRTGNHRAGDDGGRRAGDRGRRRRLWHDLAGLLARADRLRWLQAPQAAPPAGFDYPELIAHPVVITNLREIYNDHIAAHIMSFVLAFARGLHVYLPQQLRREWRPMPARERRHRPHLPEATALIVGVGGIGGEAARLAAAFGMTVIGVDERRTDKPPGVAELHRAAALDALLPRADFVILTVPHTPETEGFMNRDAVPAHEDRAPSSSISAAA